VRIIGGTARGRRLLTPKGRDIRPTPELVREAVFDILGEVGGQVVLDLYAGTGAMGLEALSRGAAWCTFVDRGRAALELIGRNAEACGFESLAIVRGDPSRGLGRLEKLGRRYDVVFCDPPYGRGLVPKTLARLAESPLLAPGAVIVTEHAPADEVSGVGGLSVSLSRRYGDTQITFLTEE
jgi:16S rRNA (guanine966-N2)-methyltransferase